MGNNYTASNIAKYIISYYNTRSIPVSNLKLQKLLYYVQMEFLRCYKTPCFVDRIEAWKHGPVVPTVYYEYSMFLSDPIISFGDSQGLNLDTEHKLLIDKVLDDFSFTSPWDLVKKTHSEIPWKQAFGRKNNEISPELILKQFSVR